MTDLTLPTGLWLPYTLGVYMSTNPPENYIPSDPQVDAWAAPDGGWANGAHTNTLAAIWNTAAAHQCFGVVILSNGRVQAYASRDGSESVTTTCTTALPTNAKGVRCRYEKSTAKIRYYYTLDAHTVTSPTWTELGTAGGFAVAGFTAGQSLYAPPRRTRLGVGDRGNSSALMFGGVMYRVIWTDGATTVADCDLSKLWTKDQRRDAVGNDWNLHGSSSVKWQLTTDATVGLETRLTALEGAGSSAAALKTSKPADTTRDSTTAGTVADDPDLLLAVAANTLYRVEAYLMYDASTAGDLVFGFTFPAGATLDWYSGGMVSNVTGTSGAIQSVSRSTGSPINVGGAGAGTVVVARPVGYLQTGGTAGNLTVQWAQGTADAVSPTILKARSRLVLTPL